MKLQSDITWFEEAEYIGTSVSFPSGSVWRLDSKVREHEYYNEQADVQRRGRRSEARGLFFCSKLTGRGPSNAAIKIRLQIPWVGSVEEDGWVRAQQATLEPPRDFQTEINALRDLTKAHCSSTPSLLDWKKEQQSDHEWVPGGYKLSILMEWLPGIDPTNLFVTRRMDRAERDALRAAFKKAWL